MAYYFLLSPQILAQQQLLPANQQQLLAQQLIQSQQQLQQGEDLIQHRPDAIDLTDEEVEEKKFKIEPRHGIYAQYEETPQHHISSWEPQHHQQHSHHQSNQSQQSHHQSISTGHQYQTIEQNEIWHSGSEPTTSDECVLPDENISNYETVIETEEIVEELSPSPLKQHSESGSFEPEPVQTAQKEKSLVDFIERYPSKCGEIYLSKSKQYKLKCHYCKEIAEGISSYVEHIRGTHIIYPYNTDVIEGKSVDVDAEKCGNIFMSNDCSFLYVCTICNKPFEDFQPFSKHISDYHLNILLGNPKTFLDAFQLFAKKMEEKTEFVNETTVHKTTSKVRGSKTLKEARENSTPIRSQTKTQPQKCDLCNYQCRTLKQLAKHNELHVMQSPRVVVQHQPQNQQHQQQLQQHQNIYYGNYGRTTDAEEARLAAEFILS